MYSPPLTKTNKLIIIVCSAFFILGFISTRFLGFSIAKYFSLSLWGIKSGLIFQFLSYIFVSTGIMSFIFSMLLIWFLGGELENNWGAKFYQKFLAVTVLATGLFFLLLNLLVPSMGAVSLMGIDSLCYALLVGYALIFPDRELLFMFLFPVKAKYFCILLGLIQFFNAMSNFGQASAWAQVFALVFAFAYLLYLSKKARGERLFPKKTKKKKPHLKIVKDEDSSPKYWH